MSLTLSKPGPEVEVIAIACDHAWLTTPFEGGRHQERLDLLEQLAGPRPDRNV
jgi:ribose 5-phosphate isomerase RpiB